MTNQYWRILGLVLFAGVALMIPADAWATSGGTQIFNNLCAKTNEAWTQGRRIVYVIGGIAALSLGVLAFFGRFKWTTFFALLGGLFLIAMFDQVLQYATSGGSYSSSQVQC